MTNFLCFVIALHVVSFANLYVIKNFFFRSNCIYSTIVKVKVEFKSQALELALKYSLNI